MSVVDTAMACVGRVRYSFGANRISDNQGVGDCSSFIQYVFRENGISIGRDTTSQVRAGKEVSRSELQPGDLVFLQGTYRAGVSHVGIYAGNGKVIENSSGKGQVVVSDFNSGQWKSKYLTARRVEGSSSNAITGNSPTLDTDDNSMWGKIKSFFSIDWNSVVSVILLFGCVLLAIYFIYQSLEAM